MVGGAWFALGADWVSEEHGRKCGGVASPITPPLAPAGGGSSSGGLALAGGGSSSGGLAR